ncbi:MAG: hypothetical protein NVSMB51_20030 [Solirubrobacteraceae bacterium]
MAIEESYPIALKGLADPAEHSVVTPFRDVGYGEQGRTTHRFLDATGRALSGAIAQTTPVALPTRGRPVGIRHCPLW